MFGCPKSFAIVQRLEIISGGWEATIELNALESEFSFASTGTNKKK